MLDQALVFLDLETTGATPTSDRITEIGLLEVVNGEMQSSWSQLVNPQSRIPPFIESLTGITSAMVEHEPTFAQIAAQLFERLQGKVLVAHNARFDYGFLRNEFQRLGFNYRSRVLCTVKLSRALFPQHRRHNLDALIERHGLACKARHRALGDAEVLWSFIRKLHEEVDPASIKAAVARQYSQPSLPPRLSAEALDELPDGPGVYLFYGEADLPIYVGKSVDLRARVWSHFSGDHRNGKDMRIAQEVTRVEWMQTAGELGALLKEARLIKDLLPALNRMERRHSGYFGFERDTALESARPLRVKDWPYPGPIGLRERSERRTDIHLFDRWCYLGTAIDETQIHDLLEVRGAPLFDLDIYRIIDRALRKRRKGLDLIQLGALASSWYRNRAD